MSASPVYLKIRIRCGLSAQDERGSTTNSSLFRPLTFAPHVLGHMHSRSTSLPPSLPPCLFLFSLLARSRQGCGGMLNGCRPSPTRLAHIPRHVTRHARKRSRAHWRVSPCKAHAQTLARTHSQARMRTRKHTPAPWTCTSSLQWIRPLWRPCANSAPFPARHRSGCGGSGTRGGGGSRGCGWRTSGCAGWPTTRAARPTYAPCPSPPTASGLAHLAAADRNSAGKLPRL